MLAQGVAVLVFILGCVSALETRDFDPLHDECGFEDWERQPCGRKHDALGELECQTRGCCFDNSREVDAEVPRCFLAHRMLDPKCDVSYESREDCGYYGILEGECMTRGCCWRPSDKANDPWCFHQTGAPVQLIGSNGEVAEREGRVEIMHDDQWGTVCDDGFDNTDAGVVCRQLGFDNGVYLCCGAYGSGYGPIWMDQVACTGDETSLEDCGQNGWGEHDCSHGEDVSVMCYNDDEPVPVHTTTPFPYYDNYEDNYNDYEDYYGDYKTSGKNKPKKPKKGKKGKKGKKPKRDYFEDQMKKWNLSSSNKMNVVRKLKEMFAKTKSLKR